jgi:hypothetical protein
VYRGSILVVHYALVLGELIMVEIVLLVKESAGHITKNKPDWNSDVQI